MRGVLKSNEIDGNMEGPVFSEYLREGSERVACLVVQRMCLFLVFSYSLWRIYFSQFCHSVRLFFCLVSSSFPMFLVSREGGLIVRLIVLHFGTYYLKKMVRNSTAFLVETTELT